MKVSVGQPPAVTIAARTSPGFCPFCHVALITHDGRACWTRGGRSYVLEGERFTMGTCELHAAVQCDHWQEVWREAGR